MTAKDGTGPRYRRPGSGPQWATAARSSACSFRRAGTCAEFHCIVNDIEMATQLGLSREAIKSRLHRARGVAREYLDS